MLRNILTLALLATSALGNPVPTPDDPPKTNVCVLVEGEGGYVIDPFNRPQCACDCIKYACEALTETKEDYIRCATTPWPGKDNPWSGDLITYYGSCIGSRHCVA